MNNPWPNKMEREKWEVENIIQIYSRMTPGRHFEKPEKSEKPDYRVKDSVTGEIFGVELTSVYMNDRSVPDEHIPPFEGAKDIPLDPQKFNAYLDRLVDSVRGKIAKAQKDYDNSVPLILSVYVNEDISIYIEERHLNKMVKGHPEVFDKISPFLEIVFWPLPGEPGTITYFVILNRGQSPIWGSIVDDCP